MKRNLLKTLAVACVTSVMLMGCGNTGSAEDNSSKGNTITVTDVINTPTKSVYSITLSS